MFLLVLRDAGWGVGGVGLLWVGFFLLLCIVNYGHITTSPTTAATTATTTTATTSATISTILF